MRMSQHPLNLLEIIIFYLYSSHLQLLNTFLRQNMVFMRVPSNFLSKSNLQKMIALESINNNKLNLL